MVNNQLKYIYIYKRDFYLEEKIYLKKKQINQVFVYPNLLSYSN